MQQGIRAENTAVSPAVMDGFPTRGAGTLCLSEASFHWLYFHSLPVGAHEESGLGWGPDLPPLGLGDAWSRSGDIC